MQGREILARCLHRLYLDTFIHQNSHTVTYGNKNLTNITTKINQKCLEVINHICDKGGHLYPGTGQRRLERIDCQCAIH